MRAGVARVAYCRGVRWDRFFEDLEDQLDSEWEAERAALDTEAERLRLSRVALRERLVALCREPRGVALHLQDGGVHSGRLARVVNPWLTLVNTGAAAATTWFLLPAPSTGRPAIVSAFLRGHESPDLRMKSDAGNRVGGGALPGEEGSFDDDTIQYRVRHVHGAGLVIPAETYASTGAG